MFGSNSQHRLALGIGVSLATCAIAGAAPALTPVPAQAPAPLPTGSTEPQTSHKSTTGQDTWEFPDVPKDHWAAPAVNSVARMGVMEGDPKGRFNGDAPLTRYEFAVAIMRLFPVCRLQGPPPLSSGSAPFSSPQPEADAVPPPQRTAGTESAQADSPRIKPRP